MVWIVGHEDGAEDHRDDEEEEDEVIPLPSSSDHVEEGAGEDYR